MRASAGVSFYVVISMNQRFAGEARQVILAAMSSNIRPKWTVIVDPDIDVHSSAEVEWAMAFRTQPQRGRHHRRSDSGRPVRSLDRRSDQAAAVAHRLRRSASTRRKPYGKPFSEVADVPGWEDFEMPELDGRR